MTIDVLPLAEGEWSVRIQEGQDTDATTHKVTVRRETITTLGVTDEERFVHEAVATFLDHEPGTALPHDVDIDWLEHHVDGFLDEVTTRLS